MTATGLVLWCLAYVLGLLVTKISVGGYALLLLGVVTAFGVRRFWRKSPKRWVWLVAGVIGFLATIWFQWRIPQPAGNDVSWLVPAADVAQREIVVNVQGEIDSLPRLTRSQKGQFWLVAQQVTQGDSAPQPVSGRLYVTVPLLQATGRHPGQVVTVTGSLYKPKPAANPGGFDFREYLRQEGCFAGMRGLQVDLYKSSGWGWWQIQQQIVRSQMLWLGSPAGQLVSAMVLGSRGVDLPADVKDQFVRVGLAHALAASGFQTSLILGVVLALMRRWSAKAQFVAGCLALLIFVGLSGVQPAVLRAALMGFGSLVALVLQRQVKPLGSLLVVATLMLLWNPLWIWNLGFQLSFLATMGLLVTVSPLTKWLDWLPSEIAPLVAVPIAAYLWTLPVQLCAFGVLSPYSIPVNLATTALISLLSLGGMVSALAALIWSPAGSAIAWLLKYPTLALIAIVEWFSQLPGNAYAVGTIPVVVAIALYGLLCLTWLQPWWRKRAWLALGLAIAMVFIPAWQAQANLVRITALATDKEPVILIQTGGRTTLLNTGDTKTVGFTILPFLQKAGINQINWAISPDAPSYKKDWQFLGDRIAIKNLYLPPAISLNSNPFTSAKMTVLPLPFGQATQLDTTEFQWLSANPAIAKFQLHNQKWLWLGNLSPDQQRDLLKTDISQIQVLCWSGKWLLPELLKVLQPTTAIAFANQVQSATAEQLRQTQTQLFWTGQHGAIQWTPTSGFRSTLESPDNSPAAL